MKLQPDLFCSLNTQSVPSSPSSAHSNAVTRHSTLTHYSSVKGLPHTTKPSPIFRIEHLSLFFILHPRNGQQSWKSHCSSSVLFRLVARHEIHLKETVYNSSLLLTVTLLSSLETRTAQRSSIKYCATLSSGKAAHPYSGKPPSCIVSITLTK